MVNLASGRQISRKEISKAETERYNAFITLYGLSRDELSKVGNIEQQIKGQLLLEGGHVLPRNVPEPYLRKNGDWIIDFDSVAEKA